MGKTICLGGSQAIETKYLPATQHLGERIVAKCDAGRKLVPWEYGLDLAEHHALAACELAKTLEWDMPTHLASTSKGFVAVYADKLSRINIDEE